MHDETRMLRRTLRGGSSKSPENNMQGYYDKDERANIFVSIQRMDFFLYKGDRKKNRPTLDSTPEKKFVTMSYNQFCAVMTLNAKNAFNSTNLE